MATKQQNTQVIELPPLAIKKVNIHLRGTSPLIVHNWDEKSKQEMRDRQMGKPTAKKAPKDPQACYEAAFYRLPDGRYGFPASAFKSAAVDAATQVSGLTKVFLRGVFHINCGLVPIDGEPEMREDMVRVGTGTADLRYRPEFKEWSAVVPVRYNANNITLAQLIDLFRHAGFSVGIGEWRPARDGSNGLFDVEAAEDAA